MAETRSEVDLAQALADVALAYSLIGDALGRLRDAEAALVDAQKRARGQGEPRPHVWPWETGWSGTRIPVEPPNVGV